MKLEDEFWTYFTLHHFLLSWVLKKKKKKKMLTDIEKKKKHIYLGGNCKSTVININQSKCDKVFSETNCIQYNGKTWATRKCRYNQWNGMTWLRKKNPSDSGKKGK